MRKLLLLNFLFFLLSSWSTAQVDKMALKNAEFGISDFELIDQFLMVVPGVGSKSRDLLNAQSVKEHLMPVRKKTKKGSDLAYALTTCLEFYVNLGKNYKVNLSPDYISLLLTAQGKQWSSADAMKLLSADGTVSAAILPFGSEQLTSGVYATEKYKILNYLHLFRQQTRDRQKVFETKKALMRGNPVMVELKASEQLAFVKETRLWDRFLAGNTPYHLVVVGFDEELEAFEVRNSAGAKWGTNGYLWLKYDDFGKAVANGYVIVPE